jgi:hypothetical protein
MRHGKSLKISWIASWVWGSRSHLYYNHGGLIRDPNDDKFVTAAINGSAEAIITFNIKDYVPRDSRVTGLGIQVCRPGDILRRLSWRPSATSPSGSLLH